MQKVKVYDTTLRDGSQGEGISFSVEDKLKIMQKLDALGIHYIEGGWPGSNPKDVKFFQRVKTLALKNTKIAAFGSTRRAKIKVEADLNLKALLEAETPVVTIFGKSWHLHIKDVLKTTLPENLKMIGDSIKYLKSKGREVIFDAEHFFDGYKNNQGYALKTLKVAQEAGADSLVLCDTNGGTMPYEIQKIIEEVQKKISTPLGIHTHNDSEMAVANTIMAVKLGVEQVQGTINGYGERCGNANLCSLIPNLKLKLGVNCITDKQMENLTKVSRFVDELANLAHNEKQPYVGNSAFAHKGGMHVNAVRKNPASFEHIKPELVGNHRRILISELSGKSNILYKAKEYNLDLEKGAPEVQKILEDLKKLEEEGYQFEGAEGSFELLMRKALGKHRTFFSLEGFRVIVEKREDNKLVSEATIKVNVEGKEEHTTSEGDGPVDALDNALRKALERFYPILKQVYLTDYKVRILNPETGTEAITRVLIESSDGEKSWGTVGVSENIMEASWQALVDSIEYKLLKESEKK